MSNNENTIVFISGTTIILVCTLALIFRLIDKCRGTNHEQYNNQEDINYEDRNINNLDDNNINNKISNVEITKNEIDDETTDLPSYSELYLKNV